MTTIAQFGDRVLVSAVTMRVIGYREDDGTERYKVPQANDVPWFDALVDAWPGDPVTMETDPPNGPRFLLEPEPNGAAIVRYRRLPVSTQVGIVVGNTWRWEGIVMAKGMGGARRSLALYQVALQPPGRSAKALVLFVHPSDLTLVDVDHQVHAARTDLIGAPAGGRLGGT